MVQISLYASDAWLYRVSATRGWEGEVAAERGGRVLFPSRCPQQVRNRAAGNHLARAQGVAKALAGSLRPLSLQPLRSRVLREKGSGTQSL